MLSTGVFGGEVVLPHGTVRADILISGERISAITAPDSGAVPRPDRVIDATGTIVLPGAIDVHVHPYTDGWGGTLQAAAFGGVTTALFFVKPDGYAGIADALADSIRKVTKEAVIDFGFHAVLRHPFAMADIESCVKLGAPSFKIFMAHARREERLSDVATFNAMRMIASVGGLCLVHAEKGDVAEALEDELRAQGHTAPEDYLSAHHPLIEGIAIATAMDLAALAGCDLYVVHVTTREGLRHVKHARERGQRVFAEACLPFMLLTSDELIEQGPILKVQPALRTPDNVEALWEQLEIGVLDVASSDQAAQLRNSKANATDIFDAPAGLPGTELLLPLLYAGGVVKRGMSLAWLARVLSENPARIFGLYPQKGAIHVGADADLVIFDPRKERRISAEDLHTAAGYTPYDGWVVNGSPVLTLVRGRTIVEDDKPVASPGYGTYLARSATYGLASGATTLERGTPSKVQNRDSDSSRILPLRS